MQEFKGRWLYMGWQNRPWRLEAGAGDVDLQPIIEKLLASMDGKLVRQEHLEGGGYVLSVDPSSGWRFNHEGLLLEKVVGWGGTNLFASLDTALCQLSGRLMKIEVEDGQQLKFAPDPSEEVFGVYFVDEGNSCEVPEGEEERICKVRQAGCCIFFSVMGDSFRCEKFNAPTARMMLDRLAKGTVNATRIGNCTLLGRKDANGKIQE